MTLKTGFETILVISIIINLIERNIFQISLFLNLKTKKKNDRYNKLFSK